MADKYRMYVDEVGNATMRSNRGTANERYLSLTGIIATLDHVRTVLAPTLEQLKQTYFDSHPDYPVILHRKELLHKAPPFSALRDPNLEKAFNLDLLELIEGSAITVVTVVIDKVEHSERYGQWAAHPYHYCMQILVERFCLLLASLGATGDVMAESRGGKEDMALKTAFKGLYEHGTQFVRGSLLQARLTSGELKVKQKSANIAGLQLADIIAHPSFAAVKAQHMREALPATFGGEIARILEECKYRRSPNGRTLGWGKVWLPN